MESAKIDMLVSKGDRLATQQRYEEAIAVYDRALALDPHDGAVLYAKGVSLLLLCTHEGNCDALRCFEAALDAGYDTALLWYRLGSVLGLLKRYQEALDATERAVGMDPSMAYAWSNVTSQLWRLGRDDEAVVAADRALSLDDTFVRAWFNKGMALYNLRRYEEAQAAFGRATALDPCLELAHAGPSTLPFAPLYTGASSL
jgi:tetratricopeptide (TPR) repeat protein